MLYLKTTKNIKDYQIKRLDLDTLSNDINSDNGEFVLKEVWQQKI